MRGLVALRHEVVHCPLLEIEPLGDEPIDVSGFDWVIVTSVNGARELRRRLVGEPMRVAAIGQATADAFGRADLVPAVATQEGLLAELPRPAGRVLFAGAEGARRLLVDELGAEFVPLYRTRELAPAATAGRRPRRARVRVGGARVRSSRRRHPGRQHRPADDGSGPGGRDRSRPGGADARRRRPARRYRVLRVFVTFLSDFGLQDDFVGTCHGVIKRIAPEAQIIDITHGIPRQQILQGALVLANTIRYMPVGSHLAVVDPGVGGARRALALRDRDGRYFVGPDNGLLIPAAERAGVEVAHELANPDVRARSGLAHLPRPRPLRARGGTPRRGSGARRTRAAGRPRRARAARPARAGAARRPDHRDDPLRRLIRQHRPQPDARPRRRSGDRAGDAGRAGSRRGAVLRRRGANVRRRAAGRHHALRGQLPEHVRRDQQRQRGRDAARARIGQPIRINVGRL